jgi:SHS2 domain-containing protein
MTQEVGRKFSAGTAMGPDHRDFEFVGHTADIAVRLFGRSLASLFEAAAAGFTEALTDGSSVQRAEERQLELAAPDLEQLLVDWLEELLFLFETDEFLVREADVTITDSTTRGTKSTNNDCVILGTLHGETRDPSRHPLKLLIKAVTYHGLHITPVQDGYEATVIFDI